MIRLPPRMRTVPPPVAAVAGVVVLSKAVRIVAPSCRVMSPRRVVAGVKVTSGVVPPTIVASPAEATLTIWTRPRGARMVEPFFAVEETGPLMSMLPPTTDKVRARLVGLFGTWRVGAKAFPWIEIAAGVFRPRNPNAAGAAALRGSGCTVGAGTE